jgi:acyl carrier protein
MDELKSELKTLIIETLKLEDVQADEIVDDEPLFRDGLGLDSIDALELTVALEKRYKLSIPDEEVGKKAFASINTLASFVSDNRRDL